MQIVCLDDGCRFQPIGCRPEGPARTAEGFARATMALAAPSIVLWHADGFQTFDGALEFLHLLRLEGRWPNLIRAVVLFRGNANAGANDAAEANRIIAEKGLESGVGFLPEAVSQEATTNTLQRLSRYRKAVAGLAPDAELPQHILSPLKPAYWAAAYLSAWMVVNVPGAVTPVVAAGTLDWNEVMAAITWPKVRLNHVHLTGITETEIKENYTSIRNKMPDDRIPSAFSGKLSVIRHCIEHLNAFESLAAIPAELTGRITDEFSEVERLMRAWVLLPHGIDVDGYVKTAVKELPFELGIPDQLVEAIRNAMAAEHKACGDPLGALQTLQRLSAAIAPIPTDHEWSGPSWESFRSALAEAASYFLPASGQKRPLLHFGDGIPLPCFR